MGLLNKFVRKPNESEDDKDIEDDINLGIDNDIEVVETDFTSMKFEAQEIEPDEKAASTYLRSTEVHEIEELRANVGKMANALRDSMRLSQDTVGDIDKISRFLEIAEANTISVERLRPENTKLKSKLDSVRDEIAKADARVREVETRAEMYKSRLEQSFEELAATRARLIEVEETFRREQSKRSETNQSVEKLLSERRDLRIVIEELESNNDGLVEKFEGLKSAEELRNRKIVQLMKQSEHLAAQIEDERQTKYLAVSKLRSLKLDYTDLKSKHIESLSKLDFSKQEIKSYHKILSDFKKHSEDKIFALKSALDTQKTQQKVNDDMARYETEEQAKLKTEANRAKRRANQLEKMLKQNMADLKDNRDALANSKADNEALNEKFLAVLVEMDGLRRTHQRQTKILGEYSTISAVPSGPDNADSGKSTKSKSRPADQLSGQTIRGDGMIDNLKVVTKPIRKS